MLDETLVREVIAQARAASGLHDPEVRFEAHPKRYRLERLREVGMMGGVFGAPLVAVAGLSFAGT
jgi:hypothetical protein